MVEVALLAVGEAPAGVGHGVLRVEAGGLVEVGDGVVEVALLIVGDAPVEVGHGEFRVESDGLVVVGDGAAQVALLVKTLPRLL